MASDQFTADDIERERAEKEFHELLRSIRTQIRSQILPLGERLGYSLTTDSGDEAAVIRKATFLCEDIDSLLGEAL